MASIIGSAVLNAAAFTGGNYVAKYLSGDSRKAALEEETRQDKALETYQAAYALSTHATAQSSSSGYKPTRKSKSRPNRTSRKTITRSNSITRPNRTSKSSCQRAPLPWFLSAKSAAETKARWFLWAALLRCFTWKNCFNEQALFSS